MGAMRESSAAPEGWTYSQPLLRVGFEDFTVISEGLICFIGRRYLHCAIFTYIRFCDEAAETIRTVAITALS